jgi:hypothetical protein
MSYSVRCVPAERRLFVILANRRKIGAPSTASALIDLIAGWRRDGARRSRVAVKTPADRIGGMF